MLYTGDKTQDLQNISSVYWSHVNHLSPSNPETLQQTREPLLRVISDMYNHFPGDRHKASPFKLMAWVATCLLIRQPFNDKTQQSKNARLAYNTIFTSLEGCEIKRNNETHIICNCPDALLSEHSSNDIINFLQKWETIFNINKDKNSIMVFYAGLSLLIEQVVYRAFPSLSYSSR